MIKKLIKLYNDYWGKYNDYMYGYYVYKILKHNENRYKLEEDYLIKKLDNLNCKYVLHKSDFYMQYVVYIDDSNLLNSDEFMTKEAEIIFRFIEKLNSDYGLFFTDDKEYLKLA